MYGYCFRCACLVMCCDNWHVDWFLMQISGPLTEFKVDTSKVVSAADRGAISCLITRLTHCNNESLDDCPCLRVTGVWGASTALQEEWPDEASAAKKEVSTNCLIPCKPVLRKLYSLNVRLGPSTHTNWQSPVAQSGGLPGRVLHKVNWSKKASNKPTRDVNETRESGVSIFFSIPEKEFLDFRESRLTRPPDNRAYCERSVDGLFASSSCPQNTLGCALFTSTPLTFLMDALTPTRAGPSRSLINLCRGVISSKEQFRRSSTALRPTCHARQTFPQWLLASLSSLTWL